MTSFDSQTQDTLHFSWRRKTPFKQRRLDFCLASDSLQENIKSTDIILSVGSDHSAIKIKFCSLQEGSREQRCWKFDSSLIEDEKFAKSLKKKYRISGEIPVILIMLQLDGNS